MQQRTEHSPEHSAARGRMNSNSAAARADHRSGISPATIVATIMTSGKRRER